MAKLDKFTTTSKPYNKQIIIHKQLPLQIVIGSVCTHAFYLPYLLSKANISDFNLVYNQGTEIRLTKEKAECTITEYEDGSTIIEVILSSSDTNKFTTVKGNAAVQIVFNGITEDSVYYDRPHGIKVIVPADQFDVTDTNQKTGSFVELLERVDKLDITVVELEKKVDSIGDVETKVIELDKEVKNLASSIGDIPNLKFIDKQVP